MILSMIAAMDRNSVIGVNNDMPWHLPDDLRFFRRTTHGKPVIMGRKTWESIGRPLRKRLNIVLTRDRSFKAEGALVLHSVDDALEVVASVDEAFIAGGGEIYALFLERADRLYLTYIDCEVDGDVVFPAVDDAEWDVTWREPHATDERHQYAFEWVILDRK